MSVRDFLGKGFSFPPSVDPATGRFRMVSEEEDIKQAIYIILMTRKGEYAMQPDFGSNLHNYVYELPDQAFTALIASDVVETLAAWEPRVVNVATNIETKDLVNGRLVFNVTYTVRSTNNPNNLVFPYYLYEGVGAK